MGARNKKRKSGRKRGEAQSGSAATPARPRPFCRGEAVCGVSRWKGVCLSRRPKARSAEGDGAASAAPSAKPPTCIKDKHTSRSHTRIFTVYLPYIYRIFGVIGYLGAKILLFTAIRKSLLEMPFKARKCRYNARLFAGR